MRKTLKTILWITITLFNIWFLVSYIDVITHNLSPEDWKPAMWNCFRLMVELGI